SAAQPSVVPVQAAPYPASCQKFAPVTVSASPAAGGTVIISHATSDGLYPVGHGINLIATANSGYVFSSFQGIPNTTNPAQLTVTGPLDVTALFVQPGSYVITTSLGAAGRETVDRVTTNGPATVTWVPGSTHTISVPAELDLAPGTRDIFAGWSDGPIPNTTSRSITAGAVSTFIANYQRQYQVTTAVSPVGGGILTGAGWHNANDPATLQAGATGGFTFGGFSGDASG